MHKQATSSVLLRSESVGKVPESVGKSSTPSPYFYCTLADVKKRDRCTKTKEDICQNVSDL